MSVHRTRGLVVTARKHLGRAVKTLPICKAIRAAREDAGLSQVELARRLDGVSQSMIARWESVSEPSLSVIARIERELQLPKGELLRAAGYVGGVVSVGVAIAEDPRLDDRARRVLLASYRSLMREGVGR
jgi:transcriptional regulator with XRE-family HTH domain